MKTRLIVLTSIIAVMSLCLFGCSPAAPSQVSVDESHNGKKVEIAVAGTLTVTLESNPTTGFQWSESADISDQTVLEQVDHQFVSPPEDTGMVGAPGKEVWTFKALKKGSSTISMEYRRPWEEDVEPGKTFTLSVVVE
ncbi:hypothetical protein ES703_55574 [subsurface metagenome]